MSDYRVKTGHDQALIDLEVCDPQPASIGLEYTRVSYGADGVTHREGPFVRLRYSVLPTDDYTSVLDQFGLADAETALVTLYAEDEQYGPQRYNGRAIRPVLGRDGGRRQYFLRDVTILVRDLVAL